MTTRLTQPTHVLETEIVQAIRLLPPPRMRQVLDFARWLNTQVQVPSLVNEEDELDQEELRLEEQAWEESYLANRDAFRAMAQQALQELESGNTLELVLKDGKLAVQ
jgi:hypothetical protein